MEVLLLNRCSRLAHNKTPLITAIGEKNVSVVKLLIDRGTSDFSVGDNSGKNALDHAIEIGDEKKADILNILMESMAKEYIQMKGVELFEANKDGNDFHFIRNLMPSIYKSCVLPFVVKTYLEPMFAYFYDSTSNEIRNNVDNYIEDNKREVLFPVRPYQLEVFAEFEFETVDYLCDEAHTNEFYFLPYFISADFEAKILNDVSNRLLEHLNVAERFAIEDVSSENEFKRLDENRRLADNFYKLVLQMTPKILKMSNRVFLASFQTSQEDDLVSKEFEKNLTEHLKIRRHPHGIKFVAL